MEWEDSAAAEAERHKDEAEGRIWLVDTSTWQVLKADHYQLVGRGVPDGHVPVGELNKCELIKRLHESEARYA